MIEYETLFYKKTPQFNNPQKEREKSQNSLKAVAQTPSLWHKQERKQSSAQQNPFKKKCSRNVRQR